MTVVGGDRCDFPWMLHIRSFTSAIARVERKAKDAPVELYPLQVDLLASPGLVLPTYSSWENLIGSSMA